MQDKFKKSFVVGCWLLAFIFAFLVSVQVSSAAKKVEEVEGLVLLKDVDRTILIELRYATESNFTGKKIYPLEICALRKGTAMKLAAANKELDSAGYHLKVWDAYRPPSVQRAFWKLMPDERYVANPNKGGSRHSRGGAVDVTLVDDRGHEVEMPTAFDDFSEKASPKSPYMTSEASINVGHLVMVMSRHGFKQDEHEWWHFDDSDWEKYPIIDVPFERFLKGHVPAPKVFKELASKVEQVVMVEETSPGSNKAIVNAWERQDGSWQPVFLGLDATLGRKGLAPEGRKKEGDGRTPSGIFDLGTAFGYPSSVDTKLSYQKTTKNDFWVDDPKSKQYNQWVKGKPEAASFERLRRDDDLYKYGIVIEYNTEPVVPGKGSAIFMHVWRDAATPTAGCVALSEDDLLKILNWLDKDNHPVIILQGES